MTATVRSLPRPATRPDLDTSQYPLRYVEFWQMRGQKYNPQKRVDRGRKQLKELKESVAQYGIVDAPVLTSDLEIVDGHRRRAVGTDLALGGCMCRIAPFDSKDPRADLLYQVLNTAEVMPGRQKLEVVAKGGPGSKEIVATWAQIKKSLGDEGPYIEMFAEHGYVGQLWKNCTRVADLLFNNGILKDRPARESFVHRAVMKWQCTGEHRQEACKIYCTKIGKGIPGYKVQSLWKAIETGANVEV
jgi:hypothetical protein